MSRRRSPTPNEKWASVILLLKRGTGEPIISRQEAAGMKPAEIIREFDRRVVYAHGAAHANGGRMHPANLWPTPREEDAKQTPKDISQIAKGKRVRRKEDKHQRRMAERFPVNLLANSDRDDGANEPARRKAVMPGSRQSPYKRKMNGKVERRA